MNTFIRLGMLAAYCVGCGSSSVPLPNSKASVVGLNPKSSDSEKVLISSTKTSVATLAPCGSGAATVSCKVDVPAGFETNYTMEIFGTMDNFTLVGLTDQDADWAIAIKRNNDVAAPLTLQITNQPAELEVVGNGTASITFKGKFGSKGSSKKPLTIVTAPDSAAKAPDSAAKAPDSAAKAPAAKLADVAMAKYQIFWKILAKADQPVSGTPAPPTTPGTSPTTPVTPVTPGSPVPTTPVTPATPTTPVTPVTPTTASAPPAFFVSRNGAEVAVASNGTYDEACLKADPVKFALRITNATGCRTDMIEKGSNKVVNSATFTTPTSDMGSCFQYTDTYFIRYTCSGPAGTSLFNLDNSKYAR